VEKLEKRGAVFSDQTLASAGPEPVRHPLVS